jgi:folate-binding protein YgfZ
MVLVPEKILLFFPKGYGEKVSHHLATFLMFANVTLKNESKNWGHLAILGPKALQILAELFQAEIKISENQVVSLQWENHPVYLWPSQRLGISGYELLGQAENMLHLNQSLLEQGKKHSASVAIPAKEAGLQKISEAVLEVIRVEAGLPKMGVDMSQDNLVAEVGLDERATSFNKGCYLGQETTARVHSQGHVNKKLTQFKMEGIQNLPLPLEIFHGEKSVGQLTSVVHSPKWKQTLGLGIVHRQAFEGEGKLFVKGTEGPSPLAPLSEGEEPKEKIF